jgi:tetratricopeptide (TPR) repeat protein
MNRVKYTEWVDDYVDGVLDEPGKHLFESELRSNRELILEYQLEQELRQALGDVEIMDFKSKCISAQNEYNLSTKKIVRVVQFTRKYWYAAASLVLIALVTGTLVFLNPRSYSSEKLFKMYYKSGENIGISRSGNANMVEALLDFSKKDYRAADQQFDQILMSDPNNFAVRYYAGISNIELKDYQKASHMFESILADGNSLYTEYAQWYLGLSYLASGKVDLASGIFGKIAADPEHYYCQDAKSILEKINKGEKNKKFLNNLFFLILPF